MKDKEARMKIRNLETRVNQLVDVIEMMLRRKRWQHKYKRHLEIN